MISVSAAIRRSNDMVGPAVRVGLAPVIMIAGIAAAAWGQYILLSEREFALRGALLMTGGGLAFLTALLMEWKTLGARALHDEEKEESAATSILFGLRQKTLLTVGILGGLAGYFLNDGTRNNFTTWGFSLWLVGCLALVLAFWPSGPPRLRLPKLHPSSVWVLAVLVPTLGLAAFFRFYDLDNLLSAMAGDHGRIILDLRSVANGAHPIWFQSNFGREALYFYLGPVLVPFFGYSWLTIKVLSAIIGVLTVPAIYFMTKELFGNRRIALIAAFLVAVSFWHVIISRVGYRIVLEPLMVALTLLFLIRSVKYNRSSDFVFSGLFLGLTLWTYTAARVVPIAVGLILILSLLTRLLSSRPEWRTFLLHSVLLVLTALVVFAPQARFALAQPELYWGRTERHIEQRDDLLDILGGNVQRTLLMFNWQGDAPGTHNAPDSAQLDYLTGAAFALGLGAMALFWLRERRGVYAYLGVAFLVMLIPSAAVISFPHEVPHAFRVSGVIPLVFAAAALPLYMGSKLLVKAFGRWALVLALPLLGLTLGLIGFVNYNTYFDDYAAFNARNSNNWRELGTIYRQFEKRGGDLDNAYLMNRPHWVDTQVLAVWMGDLDWCSGRASCNGLFDVEEAREHPSNPEAMMYVVSLEGATTLLRLQEIHRPGSVYKFESSRSEPGRDLGVFVFLVPAEGEAPMAPLPNTHLIR